MRVTKIGVLLMPRKQKGKAYSELVKIRRNQKKKKNREICRGNSLHVDFVDVTQSELRTSAFASVSRRPPSIGPLVELRFLRDVRGFFENAPSRLTGRKAEWQ